MTKQGSPRGASPPSRVAIVVKGYPRLSETFIAQEILGLERNGLDLAIWSLRHPTERVSHPMHRQIAAPVTYLPEYLYQEPLRVLRGALAALRNPRLGRLLSAFWRDLKRDFTPNRGRRLGQALVMARELPPDIRHLHVHYLHTPASVVRYTSLLTGLSFSFSAHAKDIWTTPEWEKREKIAESAWGVTCTETGHRHLAALAPDAGHVRLVYHGLDLSRFPAPPEGRPPRDGSDPADPVRIISVGRAVAKKGYDDLLSALAALPEGLHWRFAHIGSGELLASLKQQAAAKGIGHKVIFLGAKAQPDVISLMREADIFVLPAKEAKSGDRDGLPNVVMEAASQGLAIIATDFSGIPEFIRHDREGWLTPPGDWESLANALNLLARDPQVRHRLGMAAYERLRNDFSADGGIARIAALLRASLSVTTDQGAAKTEKEEARP